MTTIVGASRKAFCAECSASRNCEICASYKESGETDEGNYQWRVDWLILKCRGCDYSFLLQESSDSEDILYITNEKGEDEIDYAVRSKYWPAVAKRTRPDWVTMTGVEGNTNEALDIVVLELYRALEEDLNVLSGMGARTCFDIASEILGVKPNLTFVQKLDQLVSDGHIRDSEKGRIAVLIEAGHSTAHRKWQPSTADINTVMDILESFLYESLVIPSRKLRSEPKVARLKKSIPKKQK